MYRNLTITSVLGMLAVVIGAFSAHVLKSKLSIDGFEGVQTAVRYQMIHVIIILILNLNNNLSEKIKNKISLIFILGIVLFSGSIYCIYLIKIPANIIWFVTPLGGLLFILGWLLLSFYFFKKIKTK